MIRIIKKIPNTLTVACSGGLDSMSVVDFLLKGKKKVNLAYFNHDTFHSVKAQSFVEQYAHEKNLELTLGTVKGIKGKRSLEEFWRDERYEFLNKINSNFIVTCHHLDDAVETWVMSSLKGRSKLIPYKRGDNIYRPFLMTTRDTLERYAKRKNVNWIEDPSNSRNDHTRNYVRNAMMPHILRVNPGIRTTIRKKIIETYL